MPWKNGQGVTSEIAIEPAHAVFAECDFAWRVSSAEMSASNRFSTFPGYDRLLVIWKGKGVLLNEQPLLPFVPHYFSGDECTQCDTVLGPVSDLGVIFRRDRFKSQMTLWNLVAGEIRAIPGADAQFVFCAQGSLEVGNVGLEEGEVLGNEDPGEHKVYSLAGAIGISIKIEEKNR